VDRVRTLIRRAERDAAVIEAVRHALDTITLIHRGQLRVGDYTIDLTDDIQRLTAALVVLGYPGKQ
jgi:hypothetical protein